MDVRVLLLGLSAGLILLGVGAPAALAETYPPGCAHVVVAMGGDCHDACGDVVIVVGGSTGCSGDGWSRGDFLEE